MSVSEILAQRKPRTVTVRFLFDGDLAAELDQTRRQLIAAQLDGTPTGRQTVDSLTAEVAKLEQRIEEATVSFQFKAISRAVLDRLKAEHPPTDGQWQRYREKLSANPLQSPPEFDPEQLAPALIAACCADPAMTVADAERLWLELSDGEAARLFEAAWSVNMEASTRPLSRTATSGT